ncbi:Dicer-like protein 1 [Entomophthora muscae]|uniref:Dicer-like protein 1 n=1 Tax=Entomophthora muscae TaxID=34485 RepID=A0ACC2RUG2_9FUNG|nr:Dicer-like protein 1 [Entomophthora muscae]
MHLRIGMFLKMKDLKKERRGEDILKSHDVIFMEATTLIRLFEESLITMDEIPLIIFDNCRSTKSTHPYYHFLQEFYHKIPDESYRPKLLGLTSLPLLDSLDKISINKLKSMFAAELHIVSISERPWYKESILRYSSAEKYSPTPLIDGLLNGTAEVAKRIHLKAVVVNEQLGLLCSTLFIHHVLTKQPPESVTMDSCLPLLCNFSGKLSDNIFLQLSSVSHKFPPEQITPKVYTLLMYLLAVHHLPKQTILHVESRSVGIGLQLLIQASKRLEGLNCRCLFGAGSKNGIKATTVDAAEIDAVQKSFRVGETKLLIVCRALEEGLELPPCDVAIQFDFPLILLFILSFVPGLETMQASGSF